MNKNLFLLTAIAALSASSLCIANDDDVGMPTTITKSTSIMLANLNEYIKKLPSKRMTDEQTAEDLRAHGRKPAGISTEDWLRIQAQSGN